MSNLTDFFSSGIPATRSVSNTYDDRSILFTTLPIWAICAPVGPGTLTAGEFKTVIDEDGRGVIYYLGMAVANSTSRDIYMRITIDGIIVMDAYKLANTSSNNGFVFCNGYPVVFNKSFKVEVKSSLTEDDPFFIRHQYHMG